ncbi:TPA: acid-shock protein, partial [Yersinia enterocolitica]
VQKAQAAKKHVKKAPAQKAQAAKKHHKTAKKSATAPAA